VKRFVVDDWRMRIDGHYTHYKNWREMCSADCTLSLPRNAWVLGRFSLLVITQIYLLLLKNEFARPSGLALPIAFLVFKNKLTV
jgi:hypothetical protein